MRVENSRLRISTVIENGPFKIAHMLLILNFLTNIATEFRLLQSSGFCGIEAENMSNKTA